MKKTEIIERDDVVIRFSGDSGDGMQLTGTLFSDAAALFGNDLATFPDYPAEIRAPHNTIPGVSGFQVHIGTKKMDSQGDLCDVLVAMNPASLKTNLKWAKGGATIIADTDTFDDVAISKAGFKSNPLKDGFLENYNLIAGPFTTLARESTVDLGLDSKSASRTKNMFVLGIITYLFNRNLESTFHLIDQKFNKKATLAKANKLSFEAGFNYADTVEAIQTTFYVPPAKMEKGRYRNITGNVATAWGFLAAAERSGRPLFLGSYPITPATEILIELAKYKSLGAKVFQAEDEIAGICSAIGASYTGSLALTTTSGPGLSLKSEAIGLAVMTELPLVIVNVQRGGPSTGLPTKSEQSDLMQALFGRNGECPVIVIAASSPANCFYFAYIAAKISMEHMTPVILLTDGNIGNGSQLFRIPKVADLPDIHPPMAKANDPDFSPYKRDAEKLVRQWAIPGTEGLRHRVGGLEKENIIGNVSTDPMNHQIMTDLRQAKVDKVADYIPLQEVYGEQEGDLLVITWGSTEGAAREAVDELLEDGKKIGQVHLSYIMPLPKNIAEIFASFRKIIVCELNSGQMVMYLRMMHPQFKYDKYNKVQGLPFTVSELTEVFKLKLQEE